MHKMVALGAILHEQEVWGGIAWLSRAFQRSTKKFKFLPVTELTMSNHCINLAKSFMN
jgi:hypothetical protein